MRLHLRQSNLLIAIFFSLPVLAQDDPATMNAINAGVNVVNALIAGITSKKDSGVPHDKIDGTCSFGGSDCPGARVQLLDTNNKLLEEQTISMSGTFSFSNLKPKKYLLHLEYPRYKVRAKKYTVEPGSFVQLDLTEEKAK